MNSLIIKGNWNELAGKLKQQFANLTDDDLLFAKGEGKELWRKLKNNRGKAKEELRKIISKLWRFVSGNLLCSNSGASEIIRMKLPAASSGVFLWYNLIYRRKRRGIIP